MHALMSAPQLNLICAGPIAIPAGSPGVTNGRLGGLSGLSVAGPSPPLY